MQKVSDTQSKLLIVCGPTATGKTGLAVHLAKVFNGELVSADSRHVYTGIDIISGKDKGELGDVPVHLYDVASVGDAFSASCYRILAIKAIEAIRNKGKLPIIVGGTGLYINAVVHPPETLHIPPNLMLRKRTARYSVDQLQSELAAKDSDRFDRMNQSDRNNPRRLIRALEIAMWRGKAKNPRGAMYESYWIGVFRDVENLAARIEKRVNKRWKRGALTEASRYPGAVLCGMKPMSKYLRGELSEREAKALWVREEMAYAKRQMTWFRKQSDIHWYDAQKKDLEKTVEDDVRVWYTHT